MTATNTIAFLLSHEAKAERIRRLNGYAATQHVRPTMVVHVETNNMGMIELDAENIGHAEGLIQTWIETLGNKSARFHHVRADGSLHNSSPIYDFLCYEEVSFA